jgi:biopolymer transport protein ExbD
MNDLDALAPPRKARVEIIPLIDVVFFLLATFVLFTLSLDRNRLLDADLPKGGTERRVEDSVLYVQAAASGTYYWKVGDAGVPELIGDAELRPRLVSFRQDNGDARVLIRSDRNARFGDAVRVLDEARRAGIRQVGVETVATATGK